MSTSIERFEEESNKAEQQALQYNQIYNELCNNKKIQDHYKGYNQSSINTFLKEYAAEKVRVLNLAPRFIVSQEKEDLQDSQKAFECFKQIQQKKLFDLQCQWRAELVTLPGVIIGEHFTEQGQNILNCKLITPVSESDLDLYLQFMGNEEYYQYVADHIPGLVWQMYWAIKLAYEGKPIPFFNFPVWYYYHNLITGNSKYLILPNIRGEKENYYRQLAKGELKAKAEKIMAEAAAVIPGSMHAEDINATQQTKPSLDYYNAGFLTQFVKRMEDKEIQKEFRKAGGEILEDDKDDFGEMDDIVSELSAYKQILPIEASHNWKESFRAVLSKQKYTKLKEALSPAYEEYNMYISNNFDFPSETNDTYIQDSITMQMKEILEGRKIAGEPENFEF